MQYSGILQSVGYPRSPARSLSDRGLADAFTTFFTRVLCDGPASFSRQAYLDGELSKSETHRVEDHMHSCWTCRTKVERLKGDIATILDAQNESFAPALPSPPKSWLPFNALLGRTVLEPPISSCRRSTVFMTLLTPVRVLVASVAMAILLVFAYSIFPAKVVSAKEVLRRVKIADTRRTAITKDQVIREQVHIRKSTRGHSDLQSTKLDTWKSPTSAYWNMPKNDNDTVVADLAQQYQSHGVPIDLPLSAASVDFWSKIAGGNSTVSQQGANVDLSFAGLPGGSTDSLERVRFLVQPDPGK